MRRLCLLVGMLLILIVVPTSQAQTRNFDDYETTLQVMLDTFINVRLYEDTTNGLYEAIGNHGDPLYIAPLIDIAYFMFGVPNLENEVLGALLELTGEAPQFGWRTYIEWGSENDIALPPSYDDFKGNLLASLIDPEFSRFFENVQETSEVNLLEAVWGGVRVDGIPSLVNSPQISPADAISEGESLTIFCQNGDCTYPQADELVFGVSVDGDNRAYPLRLMNWHEMFNDVIGHTPMLSAPDGDLLCNFRAPTVFNAIARSGDEWVQINGVSASCPQDGWLAVESVEWVDSTWDDVREQLPDIADSDALSLDEAVQGRVIGRPVMLAYCTLCGAGILYDVTIPDLSYTDRDGTQVDLGETVLEFGSTGMLMRSNKLMYDRTTDTVWNAFTGIPAFGPLVSSGIELPLLPAVVTTWSDWLEEHPDTSVLSLNTGFQRDYTNGAAYGDYFNNPDFIMFPVFQQNTDDVENKEMIFGLNFDDNPRAYPLTELINEPVLNDTLGDENIVIISEATPERGFFEPGGAAVRAYDRGDLEFSATDNENELVDNEDNIWQVTEDGLIAEDGRVLDRLAGHLAFWFGWYGFYPETEIYSQLTG